MLIRYWSSDVCSSDLLDVSNNRVTQVKSPEIDGYASIQLAYGTRRATRVTKPQAGHYAKAGSEAGSILKEFRLDPAKAAEFSAGSVVAVESVFEAGHKVDVTGTTIGKGFAGTIKRHHSSSPRRTEKRRVGKECVSTYKTRR